MLKGIPASKGYAIGKVVKLEKEAFVVKQGVCEDIERELLVLDEAIDRTKHQIKQIKEKTLKNIGPKEAMVFDSHLMILEDPEYIGSIRNAVKEEHLHACASTEKTMHFFQEIFNQMEDVYLKERAADIEDISNRLIRNILGMVDLNSGVEPNSIIVAHDLAPSDTAQLDKSTVLAFLTDIGGLTSHSAIMARSMEICAVVGMGDITEKVKNGDWIIVDGFNGNVILNPSQEEIDEYTLKLETFLEAKKALVKYKNQQLNYPNGRKISVAGNIGSVKDLETVLENGGEGIGLFRTEFVFMDRETVPSEDEQFEIYKTVAQSMPEHAVVIRTLDIGGDKQIPYLNMEPELNPFLGLRAIRLCFKFETIFKTQIRALLRASVFGQVHMMIPMIGNVDEVRQAKKVIEQCKEELRAEGILFNVNIPVGIMIEIPAAAICADVLAKEVDFFSIGTNDLIQYTLAVDRMNSNVSYLYDPMNLAVLRLIENSIRAAHEAGIWCGMCGEMAGDLNATEQLLKMGLDEFSVTGAHILELKQKIAQSLSNIK